MTLVRTCSCFKQASVYHITKRKCSRAAAAEIKESSSQNIPPQKSLEVEKDPDCEKTDQEPLLLRTSLDAQKLGKTESFKEISLKLFFNHSCYPHIRKFFFFLDFGNSLLEVYKHTIIFYSLLRLLKA